MPLNAGGCAVFFGKYSGKHIFAGGTGVVHGSARGTDRDRHL